MDVASNTKQWVSNLADTPFRRFFAALATVYFSTKRRAPNLFYIDRDGDWVNNQPGVTFVNPAYCSVPAEQIQSELRDLWLHEYKTKLGDTIVVDGYRAKDGSHLMDARRVTLPDGRIISGGSAGDGGPGDNGQTQ